MSDRELLDKRCRDEAEEHAGNVDFLMPLGCSYCTADASHYVAFNVEYKIHTKRYYRYLCPRHAQMFADVVNAHDERVYGPQQHKRVEVL